MAFEVVAVSASAFPDWPATQAAPAQMPDSAQARRSREVFVNARCAECHTIRGTPARGDVGPDLTHVASRRTLAAGTIPNTRGHLASWIADPQSVKRASLMPRVELSPDELWGRINGAAVDAARDLLIGRRYPQSRSGGTIWCRPDVGRGRRRLLLPAAGAR